MSDYSDSEDDYDDREADIACDWSDGPKQQNDPLFKLHCQLCSCPLAVTFHSSIGAVDFSERQAVVAVLPCNHCFHSVCLDDYSSSSQQLRCPVFKGPSLACAEFQERQRLAEQHQRERERLAEQRRREKERLAAQQRLEQEAARAASSKGKSKKGGAIATATAAIAKAVGLKKNTKKKGASPIASKKTGKK